MDLKSKVRKQMTGLRSQQKDQDEASRLITKHLTALSIWQAASTVLFYVDIRDEVRTRPLLQATLSQSRTCVVPFCLGPDLKLIHLQHWDELIPGAFGILEPEPSLRNRQDRHILPDQIDLALVPGLAFDRSGGRIGYGRGFYDRLLPSLRVETPRIGLAYDCQMIAKIPMEPHDQRMNWIVTEHEALATSIQMS